MQTVVARSASSTMSTLAGHRRPLDALLPDLEYVMKYTDRADRPGDHWFWRCGRQNHGHNARGQAILRWRVRPSADSGWRAYGEYVVVRLLLQHRGLAPRGSRFISVCGLSQCVNPDHWNRVDVPVVWRVQVRADGDWQLVRVTTGEPATREVAINATYDGVVHLIAVTPRDQRVLGPPRAVCGLELVPDLIVATAVEPTCKGCL